MLKEESHSDLEAIEEAALWKRFVSDRDSETRGRLIERYLVATRRIAAALYANRSDNSVDFGDYLQYARIGLLEAIDRYDPAKEANFATFATYRIRGSVLNGIEKATEQLTQRAHYRRMRQERLSSIKEQADASTADAFARMVDLTLSVAIGHLLEDSGLWMADEADHSSDPYLLFELKRLRERLGILVDALPDRERQIIKHHYFEHKDFMDIAEIMGISRGRASQLHARGLKLLREGYQALSQFSRRV